MRFLPYTMRYLLMFCLAFLLSSCSIVWQESEEEVPTAVEQEEKFVELSGILSSKPLTIMESSTHSIKAEGKDYYLRSTMVDLSDYVGEVVTLSGELEGEEAGLPVVVVTDIEREKPKIEDTISDFYEDALIVSLPGDWNRTTEEGVLFYAPEGEDAVITVEQAGRESELGLAWRENMLQGTEIQVAGKKGVRILKTNGNIEIYVRDEEKDALFFFLFTPQDDRDAEKGVFYEMLQSLQWVVEEEDLSSDNAESTVCGGVAKKRCPSGFRCEFLSLEEGAEGICVDASLSPSEVEAIVAEEIVEAPAEEVTTNGNAYDGKMADYENRHFAYRYAIPSAWHWRHVGAVEEALSRVEIATEEVTDANVLVTIEIMKGKILQKKAIKEGEVYTITLPRDDTSHFEVSGPLDTREEIEAIANSIQTEE